jgi:hypothetical protein
VIVEIDDIALELYFERPDLATRIIDKVFIDRYSHPRVLYTYLYDVASNLVTIDPSTFRVQSFQQEQQHARTAEEQRIADAFHESDADKRVLALIHQWIEKGGESFHRVLCENIGYCVLKDKYESEIDICKSLIDSLVSIHFWLPIPASTLVVYLVQKKLIDRMCVKYGPVGSRRKS